MCQTSSSQTVSTIVFDFFKKERLHFNSSEKAATEGRASFDIKFTSAFCKTTKKKIICVQLELKAYSTRTWKNSGFST